jgi:hypothetical protein
MNTQQMAHSTGQTGHLEVKYKYQGTAQKRTSKSLALANSPVRVKVSVIEPSNAVKRRYGQQTGGTSTCVSRKSPPQSELWLGLAWLG